MKKWIFFMATNKNFKINLILRCGFKLKVEKCIGFTYMFSGRPMQMQGVSKHPVATLRFQRMRLLRLHRQRLGLLCWALRLLRTWRHRRHTLDRPWNSAGSHHLIGWASWPIRSVCRWTEANTEKLKVLHLRCLPMTWK